MSHPIQAQRKSGVLRCKIAFACLLLSGCTSLQGLKPNVAPAEQQSAGSVFVRGGLQQGGQPVSTVSVTILGGMTLASLSKEDFSQALSDSIRQSGIFAKVVESEPADFDLQVNVLSAEVSAGLNMSCTLTSEWKLRRTSDRSTLLQNTVQAVGSANFLEAFTGTRRAALALERATQENIGDGILRLTGVKFGEK